MPRDFSRGRHAGVLVPLFSIPSRSSWGIGEIPDLPRLSRWLRQGGFHFLQLLPLNEMAEGQNSPYSALSAMAIDPIFIASEEVPDVAALNDETLDGQEVAGLQRARDAGAIEYGIVRSLKGKVFRAAFERFLADEWRPRTARAGALAGFIQRESWWLDDYALFRAAHARESGRYWREWDAPLRDRDPGAIADARASLSDEILFYSYLQWIAGEQWTRARAACGDIGVFGDFPFMVSGDSADVWSRQPDFRLDASVGVPPDTFSDTGQDWGFPAYRWADIAAGGYRWLADRARRSAELYDGYRVDHLVGFYRTYVREHGGKAAFVPADQPSQIAQGEYLLGLFRSAGAHITAEDLGVVPDFVRTSLARLGVPGYKVLRWERDRDAAGHPFRDPAAYPALSVATSGTHDMETLAAWWDGAPQAERAAAAAIPSLRDAGCDPGESFGPRVRDAVLEALFASESGLVLLPIQDVFGWRDRVNTPGQVNETNWTWRLPWAVDDLPSQPEAQARARFTYELAARHGRSS